MRIEIVDVSPTMAEDWLARNEANRPIVQSTVEHYVRSIKAGHWQVTHQSVAFSASGRLIDGQHRLTAVVRAGQTVKMAITFDAPEHSFDVLDRGRTRSISDVIRRPARDTQVVTQIIKVATGVFAIDPLDVANVSKVVWEAVHALHEHAPTTTRFLTVVPVRAGAVLRMLETPAYSDWVMAQYRHLSLSEFGDLSPSIQALAKQLIQSGARNSYDIALRSFRAFDFSSRDKVRIIVKDTVPMLDQIAKICGQYNIRQPDRVRPTKINRRRARSGANASSVPVLLDIHR